MTDLDECIDTTDLYKFLDNERYEEDDNKFR